MGKPILFNTEMVKAILEDRKTCTRRIIKDVNGLDFIGIGIEPKEIHNTAAFGHGNFKDIVNAKIKKHVKAPYLPEDILYVRETWNTSPVNEYLDKNADKYVYRATNSDFSGGWHPSIHMPKDAARIFLKVTDVRVERLQDISEKQAINEGVGNLFLDYIANCEDEKYKVPMKYETLAIDQFEFLWNSTIKKVDSDKYGWEANPWVWVIEFEVMQNM